MINSFNETKEFDNTKTVKKGTETNSEKNVNSCQHAYEAELWLLVVPAIHPDNAQPMVRNVQSVERSTTLERSADV